MKKSFRFSFLVAALLLAAPLAVRAEDMGAVKNRIAQRLSQVDQYKASGEIGENNRGLLDLRGTSTRVGDVVAAENRDREMVYEAIAKQTGTTADTVARARARQISVQSAAGVWVQHEDGTWAQK